MTSLRSMKFAALLLITGVIFNSCQTTTDMENGSISDIRETGSVAASSTVANAYTVSFGGVSYEGTNSTWTYTVTKTGSDKGTGLSHLIFALGSCASYSNVTGASIDGVAYTALSSTEGGGTGCTVPSGASILKFDNLPSNLSSGSHTFSFTLDVAVDANANNSIWVKGGKNQGCPSGTTIAGPGCYHISGNVTHQVCNEGVLSVEPLAGATVTNGAASVTTDASGNYSFTGVSGGSYSVSVNGQSADVSCAPSSSENNDFYFAFEGVCEAPQPPTDPAKCYSYSHETSWAGNTMVRSGGWYYYIDMTDVSSASTDLWAGQTNDAGDVTVVRDGDNYVVTVTLTPGYMLSGNDNWYMHSFATVPSERPASGQLDYKGHEDATTFTKTISASGNIVMVHVNVERPTGEIPCPTN
jgi:hypothetical protein